MKKLLLGGSLIFLAAGAFAQPSLSLWAGSASFADKNDTWGLSNTWPSPGSQTDDGMLFFAGATGFHLKAGLGWEISDHFSAGLAYQLIDASNPANFRTAKIISFGGQFRVNFSSSQKQWIPFFQGTVYFSNFQTYNQDQATSQNNPSQTQPAINTTGNTSFAFNADFGLEYKLMKSLGVFVTAGFSGFQPIDTLPPSVNYSPYSTPKNFSGGFLISFGAGVKYYFGKGGKKRDF